MSILLENIIVNGYSEYTIQNLDKKIPAKKYKDKICTLTFSSCLELNELDNILGAVIDAHTTDTINLEVKFKVNNY